MPGSSLPTCPLCLPDEVLGSAQQDAGATALDAAHAIGPITNEGLGTFLSRLLDTTGFPARWHCGSWPASVGWLHICSDIAIFLAYATIPTALLWFIFRRGDIPLRGIIWLFAAFIFSCGLTHLLDAGMFYYPAYRLLGLMKLITAVVSITTAFALVRAMPAALGLPGRLRNQETEIQRRVSAEAEIKELNKKLEDRNSAITVRGRRIEQAMELARALVVRWDPKTGVFEWEAGLREALAIDSSRPLVFSQWSDLLDTPELTAIMALSMESARSGRPMAFEVPISPTIAQGMRIRVSAARERGPENPSLVGMARILDSSVLERKME